MPTPPKNQEAPPNTELTPEQISALTTQTQENTEQSTDNPPAVTVVGKTYTEAEMQAIHNLYGQALQEKEREVQNVRTTQNQNNQPQHNPQADAEQLMTDPRSLIRSEIKEAIAPLAQGLNEFRAANIYDGLKQQFRSHPNYQQFFAIKGFEGYLDQVMQGVQQVTIPIMQEAITRVLGFMALNGLMNTQVPADPPAPNPNRQPQNQPQNQPNNGNMSLPAHLRSSGPPAPGGGSNNLTEGGNPRRALTENEKRIARERRMTDDQYLDWLVTPSTGVVQSKIGLAK